MTTFMETVGPLDEEARAPLYKQLQARLRAAIESGTLVPDQLLPAERDLAAEYAISRITVRKALEALVNDGLLTRRQGAGTFVATRLEKNISQLSSFSEDMTARGYRPRNRWLQRELSTVSPEEVMNFGLGPGTEIYRFHRIRYANDAPIALEYAIVPAFCLPSADAVDASLYEALEKGGFRPARALQRLRAVLLDREQAEMLDAEEKDAGLLVERRGFLEDGRIIEIARTYYRGDTYDFVAELSANQIAKAQH